MIELIRVRGGGRFVVRPMAAADADVVRAGFLALSPAALRTRFFSPGLRLTSAMLDDLVAVVPGERLVLLAFECGTGRLAGGARAVRVAHVPAVADVAVTVGASFRGQGLGTALLAALHRAARAEGIERLTGHVLVDNAAAQALVRAAGGRTTFDEPGVLRFEIPIAQDAAVAAA